MPWSLQTDSLGRLSPKNTPNRFHEYPAIVSVRMVDDIVAISHSAGLYGQSPPYSPDSPPPEYPFGSANLSAGPNPAYAAVREALHLLELDASSYDTPAWNPLGEIIRPGQTVVLKPNFILHRRISTPDHGDCLITHDAVIRAMADYVFIALDGRGRIIVADASQNDADFDVIRQIAGLNELQEFYRRVAGFEIEVFDLRPQRALKHDGVIVGHEVLPGDPAGYVKVDLGRDSALAEIEHLSHLLYGSEYDTRELQAHHHAGVHEYLVCKTILDADCVINLPKLKTHKKTGITAALKNLVGINGNKNWLPHYRLGTPAQGGDQFPDDRFRHRVERRIVGGFKRVFPRLGPLRRVVGPPLKSLGAWAFGATDCETIRSGNWHGNDTAWRMVLDLNRIVLYADSAGCLHGQPQRRILNVVDAIIAGEGNGPLDATPRPTGLVIAGASAPAVDHACARIMGFDTLRIPLLAAASRNGCVAGPETIGSVPCHSNDARWNTTLATLSSLDPPFAPHRGWSTHTERGEHATPSKALRLSQVP